MNATNKIKPSFWFMRDNHTFCKPEGKNIHEIKQSFIKIAKENPYGVVCDITIFEEGKTERKSGITCHVDGDGYFQSDVWFSEAIKEECVFNYKN